MLVRCVQPLLQRLVVIQICESIADAVAVRKSLDVLAQSIPYLVHQLVMSHARIHAYSDQVLRKAVEDLYLHEGRIRVGSGNGWAVCVGARASSIHR